MARLWHDFLILSDGGSGKESYQKFINLGGDKMVGIINNKGDKGLKETLMNAIERFNEKCREDEKLRNELRDVVKKVNIEITDDKNYCFVLKNAMISGFDEGTVEKPDITIISNRETINGLMKKEISPFKAYATGKIKIKGSLMDLLKLKEFLN